MLSRVFTSGPTAIGRVPGVGADREGVAGVRRELHLLRLRRSEPSARLSWKIVPICVVEAVARQIELHGDALPARVGMRRDQVARNVAGQHRDRIHAGLGVARAEAALERRREPPHEGIAAPCAEHSARPTTSHTARFCGGRWRMYSGNRSIFTRVWVPSVEIVAFAAAVHRPVVARFRHIGEHRGVDVVGKHAVEHEVVNGASEAGRVDRGDDGIAQPLDGEPRLPASIHRSVDTDRVRRLQRPERF